MVQGGSKYIETSICPVGVGPPTLGFETVTESVMDPPKTMGGVTSCVIIGVIKHVIIVEVVAPQMEVAGA
jgi:hypothetical protein